MDQNIEVRRIYSASDEDLQYQLNALVSQGFEIVSTHPQHDDWWQVIVKRADKLEKDV